ncbi:MFS transporter [Brevibacterium casei]|uniref:MFS transporter n=1 Tax=Brevibacterium casei TaxID=33889 RepID=A0AB34XSB2_9MICO|nr:MFS transporter [Brevibacterium casei]KZE20813.1 MFS transporter [Brevibacterium casei]MCT1550933.1 MFS transporter [Brevibacterium casei]MCT1559832.1 MFS transporter [Brevibacterium casei]MCT2208778.1 MFS transporter [Brevibacterium casei]MCT2358256.1 MFS transporter [Brevibacterium casei]
MRPAWTSGIILTGIVVAAFNLRPGVTGLSPLLETMGGEIRLGGTFLAIIGMLPPLLYGLCGFLAPRLITRFSAMTMTVAAMAMITLGLGVRALVSDPGLFLALSVLALAGMGLGNVVVPPFVKAYFPDRVAFVSTVHVGLLQLGTFVPPLVAVPLARELGWRGSLLVWVACAGLAVAVWGVIAACRPAPQTEVRAASVGGRELRRLLSTPRAWALMTMTGMTSFNNFILFTWLPPLLTRAGFDSAFAGAMLALVTAIPLVLGFVLPAMAARLRSSAAIVVSFCLSLAAGYLGLWLAPQAAPVLWTVLLGIGISTFPLALTLITLRSRGPEASAALSGFVQGGGYLLAATGPLLFGLLVGAGGSLWPAFVLVLASVGIKLAVTVPATRAGHI